MQHADELLAGANHARRMAHSTDGQKQALCQDSFAETFAQL
jgi:hypothetical protein